MKDEILSHLPPSHPWRNRLLVYDCLGSTNTHALTLAKEGAAAGTVVVARQQSAGRGRMGRSFLSQKDSGLYMSLILRPDCLPGDLMHLTCAVAVAVCDAIERLTGTRPGIKWINDLVLNRRKIAGILTELGFTPDGRVSYAIVGIGINITQQPEDFPQALQSIAGSLRSQTGIAVPLPRLAAEVMAAVEKLSRRLLTDREAIMSIYRRDCITIGSQIRVISPCAVREGFAEDVLDDGSLLAAYADGSREPVSMGEVSVRGLWDYL